MFNQCGIFNKTIQKPLLPGTGAEKCDIFPGKLCKENRVITQQSNI